LQYLFTIRDVPAKGPLSRVCIGIIGRSHPISAFEGVLRAFAPGGRTLVGALREVLKMIGEVARGR
ncbi:MAG: hypothetical protein ACLFS8_04040, partial [Clostridia bacterium]